MNNGRLVELLDSEHQFPGDFSFKFLIKAAHRQQLIDLLGKKGSIDFKESRKGNYLSFTYVVKVQNGSEVLAIYEKVKIIPGLISL